MTKIKEKGGIKDLPWGIFAGVCAMIWSFITVGLVVVFVVSAMMIAEVGGDDGLSQSWWLILLYIGEALTIAGFVVSCVFYNLKKKHLRNRDTEVAEAV